MLSFEFIKIVCLSLFFIILIQYLYPFFMEEDNTESSSSNLESKENINEQPTPIPSDVQETKKDHPSIDEGNINKKKTGQIPVSMPSRNMAEHMMPVNIPLPEFNPVQAMLNPLPNDRLMPISTAKDDPIKTRLESIENTGIYQEILQREFNQTTSKNKFFELAPRDNVYQLYGKKGVDSVTQQKEFSGGIEQPKHPMFDLGLQTNYKKLDYEMNKQKEKLNNNLYSSLL